MDTQTHDRALAIIISISIRLAEENDKGNSSVRLLEIHRTGTMRDLHFVKAVKSNESYREQTNLFYNISNVARRRLMVVIRMKLKLKRNNGVGLHRVIVDEIGARPARIYKSWKILYFSLCSSRFANAVKTQTFEI